MSLESDIKHILDSDAEFDEPLSFEYNGSHPLADEMLVRLGEARAEIKRLNAVIKGGETAIARELCATQIESFITRLHRLWQRYTVWEVKDVVELLREWAQEVRSSREGVACATRRSV